MPCTLEEHKENPLDWSSENKEIREDEVREVQITWGPAGSGKTGSFAESRLQGHRKGEQLKN